ncbi:thioesterase II family protein [Streptomyces fimicarius]|uniref:Pyochelin biosynthesis editing thioesterase PchC n=1 Tax=Streptomyces sp. CMC78 TaxID=3231512 RepID=A0AB33KTP5_9ACTN|nr:MULTISPECIES: thioesterase domain-containing protein [Streptomyces]MCL6290644.1 thioesterase domain-containing protein [Streptomyces sp. 43Y-GA-1]MCX4707234.1 thioesterase domain-containing protein [Streptomyces griseus]WKN13278.1 thioesterase domain-containing protein [Streptomyces sp. JUS-F4]
MLRTPEPRKHPGLRLICFPPAGGSARFFQPWLRELPASVELGAVQYPGRGDRAGESPPVHLDDLVEPAAKELAERADLPLVLFGHGMGALAAFETARVLTFHHQVPPMALFVSQQVAPMDGEPHAALLYDDSPAARAHGLDGTASPESAAASRADGHAPVPPATVYADLRLAARYRYRPGPPLHCPVTALVGIHGARVTSRHAQGWRPCTTGAFTLRAMRGGPDHVVQRPEAVVAFILTSSGPVGAAARRPSHPSR